MTLSCSFLLNRDQAPCVRQHSTNTLRLYFNLQYKHTFLSVCSEGNILEYSYQKILEKNPSLIWYPWDKFLYHPAFVYVMEYLQPPFNDVSYSSIAAFAPISSFKEQRKIILSANVPKHTHFLQSCFSSFEEKNFVLMQNF